MASFNRVILIGNLTRDPELRQIPSGTAVCQIGLAVSHKYKSNGEMKEDTAFIDVTAWGRTGEVVNEYCRKGSPLMVEGRLKQESWNDKTTGQKRYKLTVVADSVQLLGSRGDGPPQTKSEPADPAFSQPQDEGDVPF